MAAVLQGPSAVRDPLVRSQESSLPAVAGGRGDGRPGVVVLWLQRWLRTDVEVPAIDGT
jgi:hypothetical protein